MFLSIGLGSILWLRVLLVCFLLHEVLIFTSFEQVSLSLSAVMSSFSTVTVDS